MEVTTLFSVEGRDRMGVTGGRVDLESKMLLQEVTGLRVLGGKIWGLGSQVAESEAKGQEAGPESSGNGDQRWHR